jgi:hypothetical protein
LPTEVAGQRTSLSSMTPEAEVTLMYFDRTLPRRVQVLIWKMTKIVKIWSNLFEVGTLQN